MTTFQLDPNETIIKEGQALFLKSAINAQRGRLYVTSQRVLFLKTTNVIQQMIGTDSVICNVQRSDIMEVAQDKHGVNTNVVHLTARDGRHYRFLVDSYPDWIASVYPL